jgi:DNA (cytosine-5)-methyltransferase 1
LRRAYRNLFEDRPQIRIVDLFAGAGGMGFAALEAALDSADAQLVYAADNDPSCIESIRANAKYFRSQIGDSTNIGRAAVGVTDLRDRTSRQGLLDRVSRCGGCDLVVGGPPCQGFSNANRQSGGADHPYNALARLFIDVAIALAPRAILLENVVGLRSSRNATAQPPLIERLKRVLRVAGYVPHDAVLNAADYGVPQFRRRYFLLAIQEEYADLFTASPFPVPTTSPRRYTTVRDAISDLPRVDVGDSVEVKPYNTSSRRQYVERMRAYALPGHITGHVTTKNTADVIRRFRMISPGENHKSIAKEFRHYANLDHTHSNIYRRLHWDEPSITIGHFRKSMIIHPEQDRNISLREAMRLQSLPDWFEVRAVATARSAMCSEDRQQQVANAVCYELTKAIVGNMLSGSH